jgi:hypothetical protein
MIVRTESVVVISRVSVIRVRAYVTTLLAWLALLGAWNLAARVDDSIIVIATDTQETPLASILRDSSKPQEIDYEAMHECDGCDCKPRVVGQRVHNR